MKPPIHIQTLVPYSPGKPIEETQREYGLERVCKLASNENPLGPSENVKKTLIEAVSQIHLYPDASFYECKKALSLYYKVDKKHITIGNGSNELIDLLIRIYCSPGDQILTSKAAFIAYKLCAQAVGVSTIETPLTKDLKFDVEAILQEAQKLTSLKLIFIANPNNPTGTFINHQELTQLLESLKQREDLLIVLDEAYCEFVRSPQCPSGLEYFKKYKNLVLLRTLSKVFGMAGLRAGALIGPTQTIDYIHRVKNPFNVNLLAQMAIPVALKDQEYIKKSQELVWSSLDYFYKEFERLKIKYWKSQGNFVFIEFNSKAQPIFETLLKKGIITRPLAGYGFPYSLRISIGKPEENKLAIQALEQVLKEQK